MLFDRMYKISAFGDFSEITPTQEIMEYMLKQFGGRGLLPSIFQEFIVPKKDEPPMPVQRIGLISSDGTKQVIIASKRLDFLFHLVSDKKLEEKEISSLNEECVSVFSDLFDKFMKKASRLALNTESLIVELDNKAFEKFMLQFKNPIPIYNGILDEWNIRMMIRQKSIIRDKEESINVITEISRTEFTKTVNEEAQKSIGFIVMNDLNTAYSDFSQSRFDANDIRDFSFYASKKWREILSYVDMR